MEAFDGEMLWDDDFPMNFTADDSMWDVNEEPSHVLRRVDSQTSTTLMDKEEGDGVEVDTDKAQGEYNENPHSDATDHVEEMVLSFLKQLTISPKSIDRSDTLGAQACSRRQLKMQNVGLTLADRKKKTSDGSMGKRCIKLPQRTKSCAQLMRMLDLTHEGLVLNLPSTKRDMFYKDVPLFEKQAVVDKLVDDLAATFDLDRSDLNVRATSKGIVCGGGLIMHLEENGKTICVNDSEGTLVPVGEDICRFEIDDDVAWVLIAEKEAVFQTLCRLNLARHRLLPGPGIIITGKGYPDIATRQLVKTLADNLPSHVPILALVDGDAYGLDILSVYKYGSTGLRHENAKLAAGRVEWIGLWASELIELDIDRDALIPITEHDANKAISMLRRGAATMPAKWRKELMHMLHTRRKAEIEILSTARLARPSLSKIRQVEEHSQLTSPLLDYLVDKIKNFVDLYA